MSPKLMKLLINLYPPYLGMGVRVTSLSPDFRSVVVEMPLRFFNRNYVGTHFGGSLYAMIDPFYMLMLMNILGSDFIVWDHSAKIEFIKPGRSRVRAEFRLEEPDIRHIHEATANGEKLLTTYPVSITDAAGDLVAKAEKTLYIRRKNSVTRSN